MTALARLALVALALAASACAPAFHTGPLPGEPKNATFASVEGARVRYVDEGQGPAVVLLHGFASSMHTWKRVQPELLKRHRVIALDLKGFGWTDRPEGDYSPAAQAKLVRALLDQRGVRDVAVVGHSWGASVALQFALSNPARVRRMALYAAWVFEEQLPTTFHFSRASGIGEIIFGAFYTEKADEKMAMAFYDRSFVSEEFAEKIELSLQRPGTKAAALAAARDQRFAEVQKTYADIDKPTLLLWGREDRVTPASLWRASRPHPAGCQIGGVSPLRPLPDARGGQSLDARAQRILGEGRGWRDCRTANCASRE